MLSPIARRTALALSSLLVGCSSSSATPASSDAGHTADTGATSKDGGKSTTGDSGSTKGDGSASGACAPGAACTVADKTCLGLVDNSGKSTFGLRMSQLAIMKPAALSTGVVATVMTGAVTPDDKSCNLQGTGAISWLLQFDTGTGSLKTGGALPPTDPTQGYAFVSTTVTQAGTSLQVAPVTLAGTISGGAFDNKAGTSTVILPLYLNPAGTQSIMLPLHALELQGTLSSKNDCIGSYNAAGLSPSNSCQPDTTHPQYTNAGQGTGFIVLKEADGVVVPAIAQSLCVFLSGSASTYGQLNAGGTETTCKLDASGNVVFQGDWCAATNAAATATCADSMTVSLDFAASSVLITN